MPDLLSNTSSNGNTVKRRRHKPRRGSITKRHIKKLSRKTPYASKKEREWIKYIRKVLHSIWSLNDTGYIYKNKKTYNHLDLVHSLLKDAKDFEIYEHFNSNESHLWDIFRLITIARIERDPYTLSDISDALETLEKTTHVRLSNVLTSLIFSAKIECYIFLYLFINEGSTTEAIVGYNIKYLEREMCSAYFKLISLADEASNIEITPDHSKFPNNVSLITKIIPIMEKVLFVYNKEFYDSLHNSPALHIYPSQSNNINHKFTKTGRTNIDRGFLNNIAFIPNKKENDQNTKIEKKLYAVN